MEDILVTVVAAMYNVERFAAECIDSILAQTHKKLEIFLIDDGSTDGTPQLCDSYAEKDSRIKVIHKENGGLTSVRKYGFDHADGKYIYFADGDDKLLPEAIEKLVESCEKNNADISVCGYCILSDSISEVKIIGNDTVIDKSDFAKKIILPTVSYKNDGTFIPCYCWNRLFRKDRLTDDCFISERVCRREDAYMNLMVLDNIDKISIVNEPLYYYRVNPESLTLKYLDGKLAKDICFLNFIRDFLEQRNLFDEGRYNSLVISALRDNIDNYCKPGKYGFYKKGIGELRKTSLFESAMTEYKKYVSKNTLLLTCFLYDKKLYLILFLYRYYVLRRKGFNKV